MSEYINNTEKFVNKCREIHNDFYDYSLVDYVSYNKPVDIIKLDYYIKNDNLKSLYCLDNNIKLFRIRYDQNIEDELLKIIDYLWK